MLGGSFANGSEKPTKGRALSSHRNGERGPCVPDVCIWKMALRLLGKRLSCETGKRLM